MARLSFLCNSFLQQNVFNKAIFSHWWFVIIICVCFLCHHSRDNFRPIHKMFIHLNDSRPPLLACPEFFTNPQQLEIFDASSEQIAWAAAWRLGRALPFSRRMSVALQKMCKFCSFHKQLLQTFRFGETRGKLQDNCVLSNNAYCPRPLMVQFILLWARRSRSNHHDQLHTQPSPASPAQPSPAQLSPASPDF